MWCLGETISCALTGHGTFSNNEQLLRYQKRRARFPDVALKESGASSDAIDFIRSLMNVEPLRRPTAAQALNHPWIKVNPTPHAHTASAATSSAVHSSGEEAVITVEGSEKEPFDLENQKISRVNEITQASAQWTQTLPIYSSNTPASPIWDATVVDTELQGNSSAALVRPAGSGRGLKSTTIHTKSTPALGQAPSLWSPETTETNLDQGDQKLKVVPKQRASQLLEHDFLDSFKRWSAAEKLRIAGMRKDMARETLNDLKSFGESFKLVTSVPLDLLPILSNDEEKQKQIEEKQRRIEALIKQEALIRKFEAEQTSYMAPRASQDAKEYVVHEPKRASPTPQGPHHRHAPTRSWASVAADGPSPRQGESQFQLNTILISDSESEESDTGSGSGATVNYS